MKVSLPPKPRPPAQIRSGILELRNSIILENWNRPPLKTPELKPNLENKEKAGINAATQPLQNSGKLEKPKPASHRPQPRRIPRDPPPPPDASGPVEIYRAVTGRRPNAAQRTELLAHVTDPDLWRRGLTHWQMHGWNPTNIAGILNSYDRGGPQACRYCAPPQTAGSPSPSQAADPFDELIEEYRQKELDQQQRKREARPDRPW